MISKKGQPRIAPGEVELRHENTMIVIQTQTSMTAFLA